MIGEDGPYRLADGSFLSQVRVSHDGSTGKGGLEVLEVSLAFLNPLKFPAFLRQLGKGEHDTRVGRNKGPEIAP